ncbi:MAG: hypothetical protein J7L88_05850 [Thermoplasmata archaeon]|nr:hypothetical protein [Thermoplasmata archaeon]
MNLSLILVVLSLILMGGGEFLYKRGNKRHKIFFSIGGFLFSLYWALHAPDYLLRQGDLVNGVLILLGVVFYLYMGEGMIRDYQWGEDTKSLNWLYRTTFYASLIYFSLKYIPYLGGALIWFVAFQSVAILAAFGYPVWIPRAIPDTSTGGVPVFTTVSTNVTISLVFSCTAAQALGIFFAAIYTTELDREEWLGWAKRKVKELKKGFKKRSIEKLILMEDRKRKKIAYLITLPTIYIGNLFRNAGIIYVTYEGIYDFYFAHNYIGKGLSLGLMLILMLILFHYLPELQENVVGLVDITKRSRPGQIVDGRFDLGSENGPDESHSNSSKT